MLNEASDCRVWGYFVTCDVAVSDLVRDAGPYTGAGRESLKSCIGSLTGGNRWLRRSNSIILQRFSAGDGELFCWAASTSSPCGVNRPDTSNLRKWSMIDIAGGPVTRQLVSPIIKTVRYCKAGRKRIKRELYAKLGTAGRAGWPPAGGWAGRWLRRKRLTAAA